MFDLQEHPDTRVLFSRRTGACGPENNAQIADMKEWAAANGLLTGDHAILGIPRDNPATTPPAGGPPRLLLIA